MVAIKNVFHLETLVGRNSPMTYVHLLNANVKLCANRNGVECPSYRSDMSCLNQRIRHTTLEYWKRLNH